MDQNLLSSLDDFDKFFFNQTDNGNDGLHHQESFTSPDTLISRSNSVGIFIPDIGSDFDFELFSFGINEEPNNSLSNEADVLTSSYEDASVAQEIVQVDNLVLTENEYPVQDMYSSGSLTLSSSPQSCERQLSGVFTIDIDDANDSDMFWNTSRKPVDNATRKTRASKRGRLMQTSCDRDKISSRSLNNKDLEEGKPGERLRLSEEERVLLHAEGIELPSRLPLTREEERVLKAIRRRIRNKISAKTSRAKRYEYIRGLEQRVTTCGHENSRLKKRINQLRKERQSLSRQVEHLRQLASKWLPSSGGASLLLLTFGLALFLPALVSFTAPWSTGQGGLPLDRPSLLPGRSRVLLQDTGRSSTADKDAEHDAQQSDQNSWFNWILLDMSKYREVPNPTTDDEKNSSLPGSLLNIKEGVNDAESFDNFEAGVIVASGSFTKEL